MLISVATILPFLIVCSCVLVISGFALGRPAKAKATLRADQATARSKQAGLGNKREHPICH